MTRPFRYSSERIKQGKRASILAGGILSAVLPVYIIVADPEMAADIGIGGILILFLLFGIASVASFAVVTAKAASKWEKLEVRLLEHGLERQWNNKLTDSITYESIERIVVGKDRSGEIVRVRLYTPTSAMYLSGLGRMDKMVRLINQAVPETVEVNEKWIWPDWSNPATTWVFGLLTVLAAGIVFGVGERLEGHIIDILNGVVVFAMGLWLLFFQPASRGMSFRYKGYERALGILAILLGVSSVIMVWLY